MKIFTIFDSKAELYHQPFFSPTVASAMRMCEQATSDPESTFHRHPEDYILFECGEFDPDTGEIFPCVMKSITKFNDLVPSPAVSQLITEGKN